MTNPSVFKAALAAIAVVVTIGGAAAAVHAAWDDAELDQRAERACHDEVRKRSPLGHRDLKTFSYPLEASKIGLASGSLKSEHRPGRWSAVNWVCRMDAESGRLLRVDFSWPRGGDRLSAIASAA
jgi:hypothetical protein